MLDRPEGGGAASEIASREQSRARRNVLADWTRALAATASITQDATLTLSRLVERIAAEAPDAPALLSDAESLTYGHLADRLNGYAAWALGAGLRKGDTVGLLMENCPDYVAIWLGLTKIGVAVALFNTNLRDGALMHCAEAAAVKAIVVSASLSEAWASAADRLSLRPRVWVVAAASQPYRTIEPISSATAREIVSAYLAETEVTIRDRALLIYTSGTTGLPKAANVSHGRVLSWALWFGGMLDTRPNDRMYDCLPLYHSVGGVVAVGALLARGGSVVVATSFSAKRFWSDVRRWDCTLAQYIGELCRYLLAGPEDPLDRSHNLRAICGNGLRADVWHPFQDRFTIPRIFEFYAASEGTFSLYNMEGEPGAIGRVPGFMSHRFPAALVQYDETAEEPARDSAGRCIRVPRGAIGEAIGRVTAAGAEGETFEGYTDSEASERKILRNVFADGDMWIRTGDLMRVDARGFWYFVDRTGDTFRWKGENVATLDVAEAVRSCSNVLDAVVFGVSVPGSDGRAGMAALSVTSDFCPRQFTSDVAKRLPSYARPVFLRLTKDFDLTGTLKYQPATLRAQGFDPAGTRDRILIRYRNADSYVPLDHARYETLLRGASDI